MGTVIGVASAMYRQRELDAKVDAMLASDEYLLPPRYVPNNPTIDFMRATPETLVGIPPYPGANPRRLDPANGARDSLESTAWFSTTDSVDTVIGYYRRAFANYDTIKVSHRYSPNMAYAGFYEFPRNDGGAFDPMMGQVHLVSAVHSGSQTLVFLSNTQPTKLLDDSKVKSEIALPSNAMPPQQLTVGDGELSRLNLFTIVPGASPVDVKQFFDTSMPTSGWKVQSWTQNSPSTYEVEATRGARKASVFLRADEGDTRILISLENDFQQLNQKEEP